MSRASGEATMTVGGFLQFHLVSMTQAQRHRDAVESRIFTAETCNSALAQPADVYDKVSCNLLASAHPPF